MAQGVQNVTVSLTLPISCQICLGKVRQPVVCGNYHVFCSACIDLWLTKANHCPTCRIPITPRNPCREIIGATNETECNDSRSVKKRLRKTRFELLLRDYEEEIEVLQKENEELRKKNVRMENQLKIAQEASPVRASDINEDCGEKGIDRSLLEEWRKTLGAANETYGKVQLDIEKMKEANKTLRAQNVDLVRENLRLKAEVDSRSPQKFGRYTVAALEAKISQYERDVEHLRKALERSDKYIEELESRVSENDSKSGKGAAIKRPDDVCHQNMTDVLVDKGTDRQTGFVMGGHTRIVTMRRSLSEMENAVVCTKSEGEVADSSGPCGFLLTTSMKQGAPGTFYTGHGFTPEKQKDIFSVDHPVSSTPSTSMSCLTLKSPGVPCEEKTQFKPLSYLRKLNFDDCDSTLASVNKLSDTLDISHRTAINCNADLTSSRPDFWGLCSQNLSSFGATSLTKTVEQREGIEKQRVKTSTLQQTTDCKTDSLKMSSEACMDAAYFDKVSELDSMIAECENYKVPHHASAPTQSADFDISLMREPHASTNLTRPEKFNFSPRTDLCSVKAQTSGTLVNPDLEEISCAGIEDATVVAPPTERDVSSTSKTSLNLAFQPHELFQTNAASSFLSSQADSHCSQADSRGLSSNFMEYGNTAGNLAQEGQPAKRKSGPSHDLSSPSKISKLL